MRTRILAIGFSIALITVFSGCGTIPEEHKGAAVGAGVGAAAGTAAGAIITKSATGAVVGALAGALVGGIIGHYGYDKKKSREETVEDYGYDETQGPLLTIEEASAHPTTVLPGETVELKMTYAVLTPHPDDQNSITEVREITYNGELVGRPEVRLDRAGGTYSSTVPIKLPGNAGKGLYNVQVTVQSENAKDTKETSFTVQ